MGNITETVASNGSLHESSVRPGEFRMPTTPSEALRAPVVYGEHLQPRIHAVRKELSRAQDQKSELRPQPRNRQEQVERYMENMERLRDERAKFRDTRGTLSSEEKKAFRKRRWERLWHPKYEHPMQLHPVLTATQAALGLIMPPVFYGHARGLVEAWNAVISKTPIINGELGQLVLRMPNALFIAAMAMSLPLQNRANKMRIASPEERLQYQEAQFKNMRGRHLETIMPISGVLQIAYLAALGVSLFHPIGWLFYAAEGLWLMRNAIGLHKWLSRARNDALDDIAEARTNGGKMPDVNKPIDLPKRKEKKPFNFFKSVRNTFSTIGAISSGLSQAMDNGVTARIWRGRENRIIRKLDKTSVPLTGKSEEELIKEGQKHLQSLLPLQEKVEQAWNTLRTTDAVNPSRPMAKKVLREVNKARTVETYEVARYQQALDALNKERYGLTPIETRKMALAASNIIAKYRTLNLSQEQIIEILESNLVENVSLEKKRYLFAHKDQLNRIILASQHLDPDIYQDVLDHPEKYDPRAVSAQWIRTISTAIAGGDALVGLVGFAQGHNTNLVINLAELAVFGIGLAGRNKALQLIDQVKGEYYSQPNIHST